VHKVLQICPKPPLPATDGGCKAMYAITKGLLQNNIDVKVLTMSTYKHPFNPDIIPIDFKNKTQIEAVDTDIKIKLKDAFFNLFSDKSYNIERFINKEFEKKLIKILQQTKFTSIILEGLYVTHYIDTIRKHSDAKIIYREHNIEHLLWQRKAKAENNPVKKSYLRLLTGRLKKYESKAINLTDGIAAITPTDAKILKRIAPEIPVEFIPFGIDMPEQTVINKPNFNALRLFHIGAMDWFPNKEGIDWFLNTTWPKVHIKFPNITLHLAGRSMSENLLQLNKKGVKIYGEVDDAFAFMQSNDIMIAPLFLGSGMRIKIIEAMALGKPVITTKIGAEGILYKNEDNICIAENPDDFLKYVQKLQQPVFYETIRNNAQELIKSTYSIYEISNKLLNFIASLKSKKEN
jgi:glycosyltransferase involved in cell wall biosynthesis